MGYNTTLLLMNDGLDMLAKDPQAGQKIHNAIRDFHWSDRRNGSFGIGNHANMGQVISVQHADITQVCLVGQNYGREIGYYSTGPKPNPADLEYLAGLLKHHGYVAYKKKDR